MAKSTQQILDYLSDATDCAVVRVATRGVHFNETWATLGAYAGGLQELEVSQSSPRDQSSGARRLVVIIERLVDNTYPTIPGPVTVQRI